jgi:hypothetical protein
MAHFYFISAREEHGGGSWSNEKSNFLSSLGNVNQDTPAA